MNCKIEWCKLGLIALILFFVQPTMAASPIEKSKPNYQQQILYYINVYRAKHHLSPLKMRSEISAMAAKHSQAMASKSISFGHSGFPTRMKQLSQKIKNYNGGAENVAYYKLNPKQLVEQWVASSGHRRNILGSYNLTGIGIAPARKGWAYFTQIFLKTR